MASMRSVWKGNIRFLMVSIPVKVFNAIDTTEAIKFNWLHRGTCLGPVGMEKKCKVCSAELDAADIANGYKYDDGKYVIIEPDDLKALKLDSTKAIDILGFVDSGAVPATYHDKSYFAGPDGFAAERSYALLREAMKLKGKIALGRLVLRQREELVTISPYKNGLVIQQLHFAHEVRNVEEVPGVSGQAQVAENELNLALMLVDQMETSFESVDIEDHYHTSLKELIQNKIDGKPITASETAPAAKPLDIMAALQASLTAKKAASKQTAPALELVDKKPRRKKAA